jgi:hypothetical protein
MDRLTDLASIAQKSSTFVYYVVTLHFYYALFSKVLFTILLYKVNVLWLLTLENL